LAIVQDRLAALDAGAHLAPSRPAGVVADRVLDEVLGQALEQDRIAEDRRRTQRGLELQRAAVGEGLLALERPAPRSRPGRPPRACTMPASLEASASSEAMSRSMRSLASRTT
jgi:hypothetical protein